MANYHNIKFKNNAFGTLANAINTSDTTLQLATGDAAKFPSVLNDDFFLATIFDTSNNQEIVKCTGKDLSQDQLTVVRNQEGSGAKSFPAGSRIENRITAGSLETLGDIDELLPSQTGNTGKVLEVTDSEEVAWANLEPSKISSQANSSYGYFSLPRGTTAQRPSAAQPGFLRYNTDHYGGGRPEYYGVNTQWLPLNSPILNKYIVSASGGASGHGGSSTGKFPSDNQNFTTAGYTANEFTLTPVNTVTHNILSVILKPMSTSSVFLIEYSGSFYSNTGYSYATVGRSTGTSPADTTTGTTKNVAHLMNGGDGTSVSAPNHAIAEWHNTAHVNQGAFAAFDKPNTTDFVRYCIHLAADGDHKVYLPYQSQGSLIVTELDGLGTSKVSHNASLEVAS